MDTEIVLKEVLMNLEEKDFDKLYKSLTSGKNYKPKTREHRCVDLKVGNFVLPIIE